MKTYNSNNQAANGAADEGNSIGKMLMSGIGVGMDESSYIAVTSMQNVYVKLENLTKDAQKNQIRLDKKTHERMAKNLKNARDLDLVTEQEYYESLKQYRDTYLQKGTDDWYKYTEEIVAYNKRLADEAAAAAAEEARIAEERRRKMAETVAGLKKDLEENLKSDDPWYKYQNVTLKGAGRLGGDVSYTLTGVADFKDKIQEVKNFRAAILKLAEIKDLPREVLSDIGKMSPEDGLKAANALLSSSESELQAYINGYNEYKSERELTADTLLPYLDYDKLKEAGIGSAEAFNDAYFSIENSENGGFIQMLEMSFENVPDSYYRLGENSADSFASGFGSKIPAIMDGIRAEMLSAMDAVAAELAAKASATGIKTAGSGNTYKTTYNFNSSQDTTTKQLRTAKNAAILARMRGN